MDTRRTQRRDAAETVRWRQFSKWIISAAASRGTNADFPGDALVGLNGTKGNLATYSVRAVLSKAHVETHA
jgi:hypothetical protein